MASGPFQGYLRQAVCSAVLAKEPSGESPKGQRPKDPNIPNGLWRRERCPSRMTGPGVWAVGRVQYSVNSSCWPVSRVCVYP